MFRTSLITSFAAKVPMKVVSEQLGHSSLAITADTYTSVLPAVATEAAEAVAGIVPRAAPDLPPAAQPGATPSAGSSNQSAAPLAIRLQNHLGGTERRAQGMVGLAKTQLRALIESAPPGTRTPNPLIKSQLLCH